MLCCTSHFAVCNFELVSPRVILCTSHLQCVRGSCCTSHFERVSPRVNSFEEGIDFPWQCTMFLIMAGRHHRMSLLLAVSMLQGAIKTNARAMISSLQQQAERYLHRRLAITFWISIRFVCEIRYPHPGASFCFVC